MFFILKISKMTQVTLNVIKEDPSLYVIKVPNARELEMKGIFRKHGALFHFNPKCN